VFLLVITLMSTTVFVLGANGYIGQAVAINFRKAGYKVYGLIRDNSKGKFLRQHEVITVVGDVSEPAPYKHHLKDADIVVDTVGDTNLKLFDLVSELAKTRVKKPIFIWTSSILAHGDSPHIVDETHECTPSAILQPRLKVEKKVLQSHHVRGVVIRPGIVYGGAGVSYANTAFGVKEDEDLVLFGRPDKRWSWVHVEDLADAYIRVAKAGYVVDGELFDIAGPWAPTYEEFRVAAATAAGWNGKIKHIHEVPDNLFMQISEANVVVSSQKAFNLLGWKENHLGFIAEADIYYNSYKDASSTD